MVTISFPQYARPLTRGAFSQEIYTQIVIGDAICSPKALALSCALPFASMILLLYAHVSSQSTQHRYCMSCCVHNLCLLSVLVIHIYF